LQSRSGPGLPGSSDVICGICATPPRVRPHHWRPLSTTDRALKFLTGEQTGIGSVLSKSLTFCRSESGPLACSAVFAPDCCAHGPHAERRWFRRLPSLARLVIVIDGRPNRAACSQGGVKFPTGSNGLSRLNEGGAQACERLPPSRPIRNEEGSADSVQVRGRRSKSGSKRTVAWPCARWRRVSLFRVP